MSETMIKKSEAVNLLWEEWKYRHDLFWRSLYRWGIATITISIFPWLYPNIMEIITYNILIFPVLATLMSLFAAWHIGSEYIRLLAVNERYRKVLGKYSPKPLKNNNIVYKLLKLKIGMIVPIVFLIIAIPLSGINFYLLNNQVLAIANSLSRVISTLTSPSPTPANIITLTP